MFISTAFSATLPSGYTELEYIESSGTQCIDTGYKWTTDVTEVGVEYYYLVASGDIVLFGSESLNTSVTWNAFYGSVLYNGGDYMIGTTPFAVRTNPNVNTWESYNAKTTSSTSGIITYNGLETAFAYSGAPYAYGVSKEYSMALFCAHKQGSYQQFSKARVRKFYMKDNGILVRDMVPAMNPSGVVGMYDTVTNTFFENAGTSSFTAGPEIVEETYTFLEYIDIDSDYIDTGLYLYTDAATNHYPNIHYTFMPLRYRTDSTMTNYVGARSPGLGGGLGLLLGSTDNFSYIDYFDGTRYSGSSGTGVQLNTKYEYDIVNRSATLKDVTNGTTLLSHTFGNSTERSDNSLTINALPGCGTGICTSNNKLRIYDFEVEGEAHMIPAKRNSDGVIGMYDTVRNQFYTNTGVGTITAGPAVAQPTTVEIIWGGLAEPDVSGTCTYGETFTAPSTAPTAPSGLKFLGWRPI